MQRVKVICPFEGQKGKVDFGVGAELLIIFL
jgi:hypothetical protein